MKIVELNSWTELPFSNGSQVWHPNLENMETDKISKFLDLDNEWLPYGYNVAFLVRSLSTVYLYYKAE